MVRNVVPSTRSQKMSAPFSSPATTAASSWVKAQPTRADLLTWPRYACSSSPSVRSSRRMTSFSVAASRQLPSPLIAALPMGAPNTSRRTSPARRSKVRTDPSTEAATTAASSHATHVTASPKSCSVWMGSGECERASHSLTVASYEPEAHTCALALSATACTAAACPRHRRSTEPDATSVSTACLSAPAEAKLALSADACAQCTAFECASYARTNAPLDAFHSRTVRSAPQESA
mmetsp:Transcript_17767/g.55201  ORF Transcript_17767/g.55201 Transcript_17767/m.55201 type:complete len:235 (+) Transcript_17767:133-837(+)